MATCKFCGVRMEWGRDEAAGKWVGLVPIEEHDGMDRHFVDANGVLRAKHHGNVCAGWQPAIAIMKLERPVPGSQVVEPVGDLEGGRDAFEDFSEPKPRRRRGKKRDRQGMAPADDSIPF